jgi:hypothetical protein
MFYDLCKLKEMLKAYVVDLFGGVGTFTNHGNLKIPDLKENNSESIADNT